MAMSSIGSSHTAVALGGAMEWILSLLSFAVTFIERAVTVAVDDDDDDDDDDDAGDDDDDDDDDDAGDGDDDDCIVWYSLLTLSCLLLIGKPSRFVGVTTLGGGTGGVSIRRRNNDVGGRVVEVTSR